jgi:hypothetical protein
MSGIMLNIIGATYGGGALVIGAPYQGGFYAGQISTAGTGVANFNLVIGPVASAQSTLAWQPSKTSTAGTGSVIDGPTNSSNMNNYNYPAAYFCEGLTIGGFNDWYLPAINEIEVCYFNLKPATGANTTSYGANPNAVPSRSSNYTSGNPPQTSAAAFVTSTGAEAFAAAFYWSSTQVSANNANRILFSNGQQGGYYKNYALNVRAVRRVAV